MTMKKIITIIAILCMAISFSYGQIPLRAKIVNQIANGDTLQWYITPSNTYMNSTNPFNIVASQVNLSGQFNMLDYSNVLDSLKVNAALILPTSVVRNAYNDTILDLLTNTSTRIGYKAGRINKISANTFIGRNSGYVNQIGSNNVFVGDASGYLSTASQNTLIGASAGAATSTGGTNTFIGYAAGLQNTTGTGSVMIGNEAGVYEKASNSFYIHNGTGTITNMTQGRTNSFMRGTMTGTPATSYIIHNANDSINGNLFADTARFDHLSATSMDAGINYLPTNPYQFGKIYDAAITSAALDNTVHSYYLALDGDSILKVSAQSDGAGGIDNRNTNIRGNLRITTENSNGSTWAAQFYNSSNQNIFSINDRGYTYLYSLGSAASTLFMYTSGTGVLSTDGVKIEHTSSNLNIYNYEDGLAEIRTNAKSRLILNKAKTVTDNSLTSLFTAPFPSDSTTFGNCIGGSISFTVSTLASNGRQFVSGEINYSAIEYLGLVTQNCPVTISSEVKSSGNITIVPALSYSAGVWTMKITIDSDLTTPTHKLTMNIENGGGTVITML